MPSCRKELINAWKTEYELSGKPFPPPNPKAFALQSAENPSQKVDASLPGDPLQVMLCICIKYSHDELSIDLERRIDLLSSQHIVGWAILRTGSGEG